MVGLEGHQLCWHPNPEGPIPNKTAYIYIYIYKTLQNTWGQHQTQEKLRKSGKWKPLSLFKEIRQKEIRRRNPLKRANMIRTKEIILSAQKFSSP